MSHENWLTPHKNVLIPYEGGLLPHGSELLSHEKKTPINEGDVSRKLISRNSNRRNIVCSNRNRF